MSKILNIALKLMDYLEFSPFRYSIVVKNQDQSIEYT